MSATTFSLFSLGPENALAISAESTTSAFGRAERHTDVKNTTPISSESSICSSRAAASNSLAIAKETAKLRSDPIDERASVAAAPLGIAISTNAAQAIETTLLKGEIKDASTECFTLSRNGQKAPLKLRRFVFSTAGVPSISRKRQRCFEGIRRRPVKKASGLSSSNTETASSSVKRPKYDRPSVCFATTFGATLKTVLDFAGIGLERKRVVAEALDEMAAFMEPVSECIDKVGGEDQPHLVNGLATRTVGKKQARFLSECRETKLKNSWLYKTGQANVTLGATAAVLVAHYVLAATGSDPVEVIENLTRSITTTRNLLDQWNTSRFSGDKLYMDALGSEIRALERARASAVAAERVASAQRLDRLTALHLQLVYMRRAAWPAGAQCEKGESHRDNLELLRNGHSIKTNDIHEQSSIPIAPSHTSMCLLNKDLGNRSHIWGESWSESEFTSSSCTVSSSASSLHYASGDESESEEEDSGEDEMDEMDDNGVDDTDDLLAGVFSL